MTTRANMCNPSITGGRLQCTDAYARDGKGVRCVTLNRPDRRNCLDLATLGSLIAAIEDAGDRPLLITGAQPAFCSGLDLNEIAKVGSPEQHLRKLVALLVALSARSAPTTCFVNGAARAGGVALACCADVVLAHPGATFMIPGDAAYAPLAATLPPMIAARRGLPLGKVEYWPGCLLNANGAKSVGLIDALCDDRQRAVELLSCEHGHASVDHATRALDAERKSGHRPDYQNSDHKGTDDSCRSDDPGRGVSLTGIPDRRQPDRKLDTETLAQVDKRIQLALCPNALTPLMNHLREKFGET